jgi:recombination protein RecA
MKLTFNRGNIMADQAQERELKTTLAQIKKAFGEGAIMQMGEHTLQDIAGISTGALSLDIALGGKGLPRGRVIEIFGPEASGKTTVALHTVAEAQKAGGVAAFIDAEHALDPSWAKRLGVDLEALLVSQPESAEQALKIAEMLVKSNAVDIVVIDSVAALVPEAEVKGEIGDAQPGAQARLMSQALRILTPTISRTRTCMVFINQIRQKIGVMFGNPETTSGGLALKFYASVRLDVRKITSIKEAGSEETVGSRIRVKVVKNKVAPPFRMTEVDLMHDRGICREADLLDLAVESEIVAKSGGWHSYGDMRLGNSRDKAKETLRENRSLMDEISRKVLEARGLLGGTSGNAGENGKLTDDAAARLEPAEKPEKAETHSRNSRRQTAQAE